MLSLTFAVTAACVLPRETRETCMQSESAALLRNNIFYSPVSHGSAILFWGRQLQTRWRFLSRPILPSTVRPLQEGSRVRVAAAPPISVTM